MSTIHFEFVAQDHLVFEDEVNMVIIPGADGVIGVLPKHAPLMAVVVPGAVMVRKEGEPDRFFVVGGGFVEVRPDKIILAARSAEAPEDIDPLRAEEAKQRAEAYLRSPERERDRDRQIAMENQLRRSAARLQVARRHSSSKRQGRPAEFSDK